MPSLVIDTTPSTMKLMMTIVAKTGRRMERSEIHISAYFERTGFTLVPAAMSWRASERMTSPACRPLAI